MGDSFRRSSFGQFGEDLIVTHLLAGQSGSYVDVGAHDPWRYSNTALLYAQGWRGINIDADPRAIARFIEARPDDINLNIGIASTSGTAEFAVFQDGAVNSFDTRLAKLQVEGFGTPEFQVVRVEPLKAVLARHLDQSQPFRYLNIDCEGLDDVVLRSNDWNRFRPDVISVELLDLNLDAVGQHPSYCLLKDLGYLLRGHYFATSIFHHLSAVNRHV